MVKEFGGPPTPGIGFAMGMERIIPLVKDTLGSAVGPDILFCPLTPEASEKAMLLAAALRDGGFWIEVNYDATSLRSQMRKANRIGAKRVIVLGEDEMKNGEIEIKDMARKSAVTSSLEVKQLLNIISGQPD
jgi:histidyl-tRNA synthetase